MVAKAIKNNGVRWILFVGVFTLMPLYMEYTRTLRIEREILELERYYRESPISEFVETTASFTAYDSCDNQEQALSRTTWSRIVKDDIQTSQVLEPTCFLPDGRSIRGEAREPKRIRLNKGNRTIDISYDLYDFDILQRVLDAGANPEDCLLRWNKIFTLNLPYDIDRVLELKSNTFNHLAHC